MSALSLGTLIEISVFCADLRGLNFPSILGWCLYFSIALSVGSKCLSAKGLVSLNPGNFKFLLHLKIKDLKAPHFFHLVE